MMIQIFMIYYIQERNSSFKFFFNILFSRYRQILYEKCQVIIEKLIYYFFAIIAEFQSKKNT